MLIACTLVLLAMPSAASGAPVQAPELRISSFDVKGSNGYGIEVSAVREGDFPPDAIVSVDGGPVGASYQVRAELGAGLRATFGSLGLLDVRFERQKKEVSRPEPGCRWISESGVFRGSFHFTGEGGYTSGSAVDPEGEVFRLPNGPCGFNDDSFRGDRPARPGGPGIYQTVLSARAARDNGTVSFNASRLTLGGGAPLATFGATLRERVGPMKIERIARASGKPGSFSTSGRSRSSVSPPPPFSGSARFRDPAKRPATWTGSLSVSFPGAPEVALAGPSFDARFCPRASLFRSCLP